MRSPLATAAVATATLLATGLTGAQAWGDAVYHSQHIALQPVGSAPLRSGFVENIHANGPTVYAMERYALVGATPGSYAVTLHLFADTSCTTASRPFPEHHIRDQQGRQRRRAPEATPLGGQRVPRRDHRDHLGAHRQHRLVLRYRLLHRRTRLS